MSILEALITNKSNLKTVNVHKCPTCKRLWEPFIIWKGNYCQHGYFPVDRSVNAIIIHQAEGCYYQHTLQEIRDALHDEER